MQYSNQLLQAIENYLNGKATVAEQQMVNDWYHSFDDAEVSVDVEDADYGQLLEARLKLRVYESTGIDQLAAKKVKTVRFWPRIAAVAAAITAITLGVWLYYYSDTLRHSGEGRNPGLAMNDIAPGKNTARLTMANGEVINLSDAKTGVVIDASKLSYSDGEELSTSSASGPRRGGSKGSSETTPFPGSRTMSVSTPRGGQYQVVLPDGTKVWLNADSKISFPSQFIGKERKVMMIGEGYFEVAKNKAKPFIVETEATAERPGQRVEVLGTHFNINSYADEGATKTTLLEGAVRISTADQQMVTLRPGQQAEMRAGAAPMVTQVDPAYAVAWKNNKFVFDGTDIRYIMRMVARWYNVEVIYTGMVPDEKFWGSVSRYENVSEVLKSLEQTGKIKFKIEGRRIYVSP